MLYRETIAVCSEKRTKHVECTPPPKITMQPIAVRC